MTTDSSPNALPSVAVLGIVLGLICIAPLSRAQTVDVIQVRTFGNSYPRQSCEVTRRAAGGPAHPVAAAPAGGSPSFAAPSAVIAHPAPVATSAEQQADAKPKAATRDSVLVEIRSSDGGKVVASPGPVTLRLNGVWQGALAAKELAGTTLVLSAPAKTLAGRTILIQTENQQICSVTLAAVEDKSDGADAGLTFRFGPEYTSANAFAADTRLAATAGIRWDVATPPTWSPSWASWLNVGSALIGTFDYTSSVATREYGSCTANATARFVSGVTIVPPRDEIRCGPASYTAGQRPGAASGVMDTTDATFLILRTDSVRAQALPTWRGVFSSRLEFSVGNDLRIGPIAGVIVQTDPRGLRAGGFSNTVRPLRPLWIRGAGLRKMNDAGVEVFALDLVFGGVQNYYEIDRVVVPRSVGKPDSILKIVPDPVIIGPSLQWQTFARVRLFKGASLRAFATFNAPQSGLLVENAGVSTSAPRSKGFPDIVRIAFLLDRDIKKVWDALIGTDGAKEGGGGSSAAATGDKTADKEKTGG